MATDTLAGAQLVLQGPRFDVYRLSLPGRRGSEKVVRDVVVHPGAAVVLPVMDGGRVVLIRNERFSIGQTLWELPCGTLERNEPPIECAARELVEESGYEAAHIEALCDFYTAPGICTEHMWAFLATGLTHVGQSLDDSERITAEVVTLDEAIQMISDGRIVDGKTIATLLYYQTFRLRSA